MSLNPGQSKHKGAGWAGALQLLRFQCISWDPVQPKTETDPIRSKRDNEHHLRRGRDSKCRIFPKLSSTYPQNCGISSSSPPKMYPCNTFLGRCPQVEAFFNPKPTQIPPCLLPSSSCAAEFARPKSSGAGGVSSGSHQRKVSSLAPGGLGWKRPGGSQQKETPVLHCSNSIGDGPPKMHPVLGCAAVFCMGSLYL